MEGGLAQTQTQIMPKKGWLLLLWLLSVLAVGVWTVLVKPDTLSASKG